MGNRLTERSLGRFSQIHMDPLMVAGAIRELVDSVLGYFQPFSHIDCFSNFILQFLYGHLFCHCLLLFQSEFDPIIFECF